jgi:hypothetical protein
MNIINTMTTMVILMRLNVPMPISASSLQRATSRCS